MFYGTKIFAETRLSLKVLYFVSKQFAVVVNNMFLDLRDQAECPGISGVGGVFFL